MTADLILAGITALIITAICCLIARDKGMHQVVGAYRACKADIRRSREDPPVSVGWGLSPGRGAGAQYRCTCIEHLDGQEPRWEMCSPHKIDAEIDGWRA